MLSVGGLTYRVVEMDAVMRDPQLLATARSLTIDRFSGMNGALDRYQASPPHLHIRAQAIFAYADETSAVAWALLTKESDTVCFSERPGYACLQVYVNRLYRRQRIGQALVKMALELNTTDIVEVYAHDNYDFFMPLIQQFPRLKSVSAVRPEEVDHSLNLTEQIRIFLSE